MSTRVEPIDPVTDKALMDTVVAKLVEGTPHPFANAVSIIADRGNDGKFVEKGKTVTPYELRFEPAAEFGIPDAKPAEGTTWMDLVKGAVRDTETLFKVMA